MMAFVVTCKHSFVAHLYVSSGTAVKGEPVL